MSDAHAKNRFPELLQLRLPRGTNAALDELASKCHRNKSEQLARRAILREVVQAHHRREGMRLAKSSNY